MKKQATTTRCSAFVAMAMMLCFGQAVILAEVVESDPDPIAGYMPDDLKEVEMVYLHDTQVPTDVTLVNSKGESVLVSELLDGQRPVILNFVYYNCPMLCGLVSGAMVNGLRDLKWSAGEEFIILTISIAPNETTELAAQNREAWLAAYGREEAGERWFFLTGTEANVRKLADASGFVYRDAGDGKNFYHPSGLIFLTPDGRVSQYLTKFQGNPASFDAATMRLTLSEAADGKIGSFTDRLRDQFVLTCTTFDPDSGSYSASAMALMRLSGGGLAFLLGGVIVALLMREMRNRKIASKASVEQIKE